MPILSRPIADNRIGNYSARGRRIDRGGRGAGTTHEENRQDTENTKKGAKARKRPEQSRFL